MIRLHRGIGLSLVCLVAGVFTHVQSVRAQDRIETPKAKLRDLPADDLFNPPQPATPVRKVRPRINAKTLPKVEAPVTSPQAEPVPVLPKKRTSAPAPIPKATQKNQVPTDAEDATEQPPIQNQPPIGRLPEPLPDSPLQIEKTTESRTQPTSYRSLTQVVAEGERGRGMVSDLEWASLKSKPLPDKTKLPEPVVAPSGTLPEAVHEVFDSPSNGVFMSGYHPQEPYLTFAPPATLWQPSLANQRAPRMTARYLDDEGTFFDTALGGQFSVARIGPCGCPDTGLHFDIFAAAFARFDSNWDYDLLDIRFGVPVIYSLGDTQLKLAYEHTSAQGGDGSSLLPDNDYRRHDIVLGAARWWADRVRTYGEVGIAADMGPLQGDDPMRYDVGLEWIPRRGTCWYGAPFAAADFEFRGEQDYEANITLQIGWAWRNTVAGRGPRVALEYYNGKNPYGRAFLLDAQWIGVNTSWDW